MSYVFVNPSSVQTSANLNILRPIFLVVTRNLSMCVWVFKTHIAVMVFCARPQDSVLSVSVHRVHVVFSTTGFKGGGKAVP